MVKVVTITVLIKRDVNDDTTCHTACLNLNSVNQLIFVMVKCGVLFEVRAKFLNNI
jgi:hypothetical protein